MIHGYIRVSTADQAGDDKTSLADQERSIRAIAALNYCDDPPIWRDEGISGAVPLRERTAGKAMLDQLQPGDIIIASKLDRIFRSARDALTSVEDLKAAGVDIILIDAGTMPVMNSAMGKLFFSILASFAEFERQRIADRMNDGRAGKKRNGGFIGGQAPFGSTVKGAGRAAYLVDNEREREALTMVHKLYSGGANNAEIARQLAVAGYTTRKGTAITKTHVWRWTREAAKNFEKREENA